MYARKRTGAAIAALGLVASMGLTTPATAAESKSAISEGLTKVNLLNFNDFHGRIDATAGPRFACLVENQKTLLGDDTTLLLSAGDNIGGSLFVSFVAQDNPTLAYLNALELDAAAVGNHEFDRGFDDLTGRVDTAADFPYLGANVYERGTETPALDEYVIKTVNGVEVAIIGAVTQETASLVSPDGITGIEFGDPVEAVNRVATKLSDGNAENGEADVIVAEIHDGAASVTGGVPAANAIYNRMVNELSAEVDVIFNGHTHQIYAVDAPITSGTRNISQAGQYGAGLTSVQLGIDPETNKVVEYVNDYVPVPDAAPSGACLTDPQYLAAKQISDDAVAAAKVLGAQPVGKIAADITTAYANAAVTDDGVYMGTARDDRMRESALGNLVAQAWLEELNVPGRPGADIGIMNPGGLRAELFHKASGVEGDGVVTLEEASAVNPFGNTLVVKDITGAQFKETLEQQWQPEGSSRGFLNLGLSDNVSYTFDPNLPKGSRITSVWVGEERLDVDAVYQVTSSSFLMAGGDNFTALQKGTNTRDTGLVDTEAFMNFMGRADAPIEPDFAKRGVGVIDMPEKVVDEVEVTIEGVDMTSLGAPANTEFEVFANGQSVGTLEIVTERVATPLPVRDGVTNGVLTVDRTGLQTNESVDLTLVAAESGTVVQLGPVVISLDTGFFLNDDFTGIANIQFKYGEPGDVVLFGDWDGDGIDTPAIRRGNQFFIKNSNSAGFADKVVAYGNAGDVVLVGDWNGDGVDTLAVRRGHQYFIKNSIASGYADKVVLYGNPTDVVLVGDWNGDDVDTLAVRRGHQYYVKNTIATGYADYMFAYGNPDDIVIVGDWDGDKTDALGVRRGNQYFLKNTTATGYADIVFSYGEATDEVFVGDWNGDGKDTLGVRR